MSMSDQHKEAMKKIVEGCQKIASLPPEKLQDEPTRRLREQMRDALLEFEADGGMERLGDDDD